MIYCGILSSNRKTNFDTHKSSDESQKKDIEWRKNKRQKYRESTVLFVWGLNPNKADYGNRSQKTEAKGRPIGKWAEESSAGWWDIQHLGRCVGLQVYAFVKTNQIVHLIWVHFYGCKLYLNFNVLFKRTSKSFSHTHMNHLVHFL